MNETDSLIYFIVLKSGSFKMLSSVISCPAIKSLRSSSGTLRAVNLESAMKRSLAEMTVGHALNFCVILQPFLVHLPKGGVEGSMCTRALQRRQVEYWWRWFTATIVGFYCVLSFCCYSLIKNFSNVSNLLNQTIVIYFFEENSLTTKLSRQ